MATEREIEEGAKAIYSLLQDIINHRPLKGHDMPEFQLARVAIEAAERIREQKLPD